MATATKPQVTTDIYERVTDSIIAAMQRGVTAWQAPFKTTGTGLPCNAFTRRPYSGVNVMQLFFTGVERGYTSRGWCTFAQAVQHGMVPEKGQRATEVILLKKIRVKDKDAPKPKPGAKRKKDDGTKQISLARSFYVFNVDQLVLLGRQVGKPYNPDAIAELRAKLGAIEDAEFTPVARCERILKATGARITHGPKPCYVPLTDTIELPARTRAVSGERYYATAFHELAHWTGHKSRLDRLDLSARFGDPTYALEELVAELAAAFLSARVGIDHVSHAASYLASWLRAAKKDRHAIVSAASAASKAAEYIFPAASTDADDE